jgi:hypothetical protein
VIGKNGKITGVDATPASPNQRVKVGPPTPDDYDFSQ